MRRLLIVLILMPFFTTILLHASINIINVYYNGTIEAELSNVTQFILIGSNITDLRVIGSQYNLSNNIIYLKNTGNIVYVSYKAVLPKGIIQVNENGNFTINVFLPINASMNYIYPQPSSFIVTNGLYNITFTNANKVIILYSFYSIFSQRQSENDVELYLLGGLIGSDSVLASLIFLLLRRSKAASKIDKGEEEENIDLISNVLDERDTIVLEAIKMGTSTLADIVRQTGLPKSTAYRRVKKLVKLGYIEEIREEGKVRYVVKKKED